MPLLLPTFKLVSVIFSAASIITGTQSMLDPSGFSRGFGLPITPTKSSDKSTSTTTSYVSLMGVRQLATGLTLLTFAYQEKWTEMATILSILGVVVAGTDGILPCALGGERASGVSCCSWGSYCDSCWVGCFCRCLTSGVWKVYLQGEGSV